MTSYIFQAGTDIEGIPSALLDPDTDDMTKALVLRDVHAALGPKRKPTMIGDMQVHPDSCGVEFTTPPVSTADDFVDVIMTGRRIVEDLLGMKLSFVNRYDVGNLLPHLMGVAPEAARTIMMRGCDPDYIAGHIRAIPEEVAGDTMMELGGHLHIDLPPDMPPEFAAEVMSHVLAPMHDTQDNSWYRVPGVYRPKPYGIEYRSLGADWAGNPANIRAVFDSISNVFGG